jgi:FtsH-binding integral membrane protein
MPLTTGEQLLAEANLRVRHGFIQKVYAILCVELFITFLGAGTIASLGQNWFQGHPGMAATMVVFASLGSLMMMFVFICCPQTMRRSPDNYILLTLFALCKSILVGVICLVYTPYSVLMVLGITTLIVLSLTFFACQTHYDFTGFGPYLMCAVMCMVGLGLALAIGSMLGLANTPEFQSLHLIYAGLGAFVFSCYLVVDTQMIIGGKHNRFRFSVDDYAMAAINLYVDIIQIFIFLLQLLGRRR